MSVPTGAQPFQDILDGYFTLKESVRQMMVRHDLTWVWMALWHAPVMDIGGLGPREPVPLHLRDGYAGLIDAMARHRPYTYVAQRTEGIAVCRA